jgi:hypothetical protein
VNIVQNFRKLLDSLLHQNRSFLVLLLLPISCFILNIIITFFILPGDDPIMIAFSIIPSFAIVFMFSYPLLFRVLWILVLRDSQLTPNSYSIFSNPFFSITNKIFIVLVIIGSCIAISPIWFLLLLSKFF